ncbi:muscle M-line assembly protein unc-89 [Patella vulgata]|uniref:muscle M-line assembly protein unc-89 n=1 Tax=Patella vulgata TaxID=6465 RepID=UPI0024A7A526|nr:muscle M-line assembly protein unc-89 [Patella vulgata]
MEQSLNVEEADCKRKEEEIKLSENSVISEDNSKEGKVMLLALERDTAGCEVDGRLFMQMSNTESNTGKMSEHSKTNNAEIKTPLSEPLSASSTDINNDETNDLTMYRDPSESRESTVEPNDNKGSHSEGDLVLDQYSEDVTDALENVFPLDHLNSPNFTLPRDDSGISSDVPTISISNSIGEKFNSGSECDPDEFFDAPSTPLKSPFNTDTQFELGADQGKNKGNSDQVESALTESEVEQNVQTSVVSESPLKSDKNVTSTETKETQPKLDNSVVLDEDLFSSFVETNKSGRKKKKSQSESENNQTTDNIVESCQDNEKTSTGIIETESVKPKNKKGKNRKNKNKGNKKESTVENREASSEMIQTSDNTETESGPCATENKSETNSDKSEINSDTGQIKSVESQTKSDQNETKSDQNETNSDKSETNSDKSETKSDKSETKSGKSETKSGKKKNKSKSQKLESKSEESKSEATDASQIETKSENKSVKETKSGKKKNKSKSGKTDETKSQEIGIDQTETKSGEIGTEIDNYETKSEKTEIESETIGPKLEKPESNSETKSEKNKGKKGKRKGKGGKQKQKSVDLESGAAVVGDKVVGSGSSTVVGAEDCLNISKVEKGSLGVDKVDLVDDNLVESEECQEKFEDEQVKSEKNPGEEKPVEVGELTVDDKDKTFESQEKQVVQVEKLDEPEKKIVELEEKPVELEENPVEIEEKPVEIEEKPAETEEKTLKIEEKPAGSEEKTLKIEEKPAGSEEKTLKIEEKPTESEEKPAEIEEKIGELNLQEKPVEPVQESDESKEKQLESQKTVEFVENTGKMAVKLEDVTLDETSTEDALTTNETSKLRDTNDTDDVGIKTAGQKALGGLSNIIQTVVGIASESLSGHTGENDAPTVHERDQISEELSNKNEGDDDLAKNMVEETFDDQQRDGKIVMSITELTQPEEASIESSEPYDDSKSSIDSERDVCTGSSGQFEDAESDKDSVVESSKQPVGDEVIKCFDVTSKVLPLEDSKDQDESINTKDLSCAVMETQSAEDSTVDESHQGKGDGSEVEFNKPSEQLQSIGDAKETESAKGSKTEVSDDVDKHDSAIEETRNLDLMDQAAEMLAKLQKLKSSKKNKTKKAEQKEESKSDKDKKPELTSGVHETEDEKDNLQKTNDISSSEEEPTNETSSPKENLPDDKTDETLAFQEMFPENEVIGATAPKEKVIMTTDLDASDPETDPVPGEEAPATSNEEYSFDDIDDVLGEDTVERRPKTDPILAKTIPSVVEPEGTHPTSSPKVDKRSSSSQKEEKKKKKDEAKSHKRSSKESSGSKDGNRLSTTSLNESPPSPRTDEKGEKKKRGFLSFFR